MFDAEDHGLRHFGAFRRQFAQHQLQPLLLPFEVKKKQAKNKVHSSSVECSMLIGWWPMSSSTTKKKKMKKRAHDLLSERRRLSSSSSSDENKSSDIPWANGLMAGGRQVEPPNTPKEKRNTVKPGNPQRWRFWNSPSRSATDFSKFRIGVRVKRNGQHFNQWQCEETQQPNTNPQSMKLNGNSTSSR